MWDESHKSDNKGEVFMQSPFVFELKKPTYLKENKKYPALFMMHGMGSNEQNLLPLVEGFQETMFIFSLRGPFIQPPGYAFFRMEELGKPDRQSFVDTINKIDDFLKFIIQSYPIDEKQVYLLGFSQGAMLATSLSIKMSDSIKGVVALSGYIPSFVQDEYREQPLQNLHLFLSHGEQDPVLPFQWGVSSYNYLKEHGANITFKSYPAGHWVTQENFEDIRSWLSEALKQ